jgi:hypothetical protein
VRSSDLRPQSAISSNPQSVIRNLLQSAIRNPQSAISFNPQSAIRNPQSRLLALSLFVVFAARVVQGADCNQNGVPDERERVPVTFGLADGLLPVPPAPQVIKVLRVPL